MLTTLFRGRLVLTYDIQIYPLKLTQKGFSALVVSYGGLCLLGLTNYGLFLWPFLELIIYPYNYIGEKLNTYYNFIMLLFKFVFKHANPGFMVPYQAFMRSFHKSLKAVK